MAEGGAAAAAEVLVAASREAAQEVAAIAAAWAAMWVVVVAWAAAMAAAEMVEAVAAVTAAMVQAEVVAVVSVADVREGKAVGVARVAPGAHTEAAQKAETTVEEAVVPEGWAVLLEVPAVLEVAVEVQAAGARVTAVAEGMALESEVEHSDTAGLEADSEVNSEEAAEVVMLGMVMDPAYLAWVAVAAQAGATEAAMEERVVEEMVAEIMVVAEAVEKVPERAVDVAAELVGVLGTANSAMEATAVAAAGTAVAVEMALVSLVAVEMAAAKMAVLTVAETALAEQATAVARMARQPTTPRRATTCLAARDRRAPADCCAWRSYSFVVVDLILLIVEPVCSRACPRLCP